MSYLELLSKGLSCYAMARTTRKGKYKREAMAIHRHIKKWVAKGNPNVIHYNMLFDAEKEALCGRKKAAVEMYEKVIIMSARGGLLLEAGLASERLACLLLDHKEHDDARFRLQEACKYYTDLGVVNKVQLLKGTYANALQEKPPGVVIHSMDASSQVSEWSQLSTSRLSS